MAGGGGHHSCQTDRAAAPAPSSPAQAPSASQGHLRPTVAPTLRTSKDPAPLNPSWNAAWRALVPALNPTPPPPRVPRLPVTPACLSPLGFVLMPQQGPATGPGAGKQDPALPQLGSPVSFLVPFFHFDAFFFSTVFTGVFLKWFCSYGAGALFCCKLSRRASLVTYKSLSFR